MTRGDDDVRCERETAEKWTPTTPKDTRRVREKDAEPPPRRRSRRDRFCRPRRRLGSRTRWTRVVSTRVVPTRGCRLGWCRLGCPGGADSGADVLVSCSSETRRRGVRRIRRRRGGGSPRRRRRGRRPRRRARDALARARTHVRTLRPRTSPARVVLARRRRSPRTRAGALRTLVRRSRRRRDQILDAAVARDVRGGVGRVGRAAAAVVARERSVVRLEALSRGRARARTKRRIRTRSKPSPTSRPRRATSPEPPAPCARSTRPCASKARRTSRSSSRRVPSQRRADERARG